MQQLRDLQLHAWHGCNFHCDSCSHFSQLGARGGPSYADCVEWIGAWSGRLRPDWFTILGGEPTLNRDFLKIVEHSAQAWPRSHVRIFTNGVLLKRWPELLPLMQDAPKIQLFISQHHGSDTAYLDAFQEILDLVTPWRSQLRHDQIVIVNSYKAWGRRYTVRANRVVFANSDPRRAWDICGSKYCRQLYLGKVWKCPVPAYFSIMRQTMQVHEKWDRLVEAYQPLEPNCSDEELTEFLATKEEDICRLCPDKKEWFAKENPIGIRRHV